MRLVLGGIAQGKRDYVKTAYQISENDIFSGEQLSGVVAVDQFHLWVKRKIKEGADVPELTEIFIKQNPDCIVICDEVGCGVVPVEKEEREYREQVGRMQIVLAKASESVERVICGIAQKIK